jgi:DNA-binding beta-propeller fold protein YncE
VVLDTETGKEVTSLPVGAGAADMNFDPVTKRIYVPCGEGIITVIEQRDANDYQVIGNIPTKSGAKNGILVPSLGRYYVAVPKKGEQEAQVLVFEVM